MEALASRDGTDRWSDGEPPTAYLACDPLTAIAEYARHADESAGDSRDLVRLDVRPIHVLDLRRADVQTALGPRAMPQASQDRSTARALAADVRSLGIVNGLIVPSMAFLDRMDRSNLVLFVETLPAGLAAAVGTPTTAGSIRLDPRGDAARR